MRNKKLSGVAKEIVILFGVMVVAVLAYNTWAYCCGRCTMGTFTTLGPTGLGLLGANLVAFAVLVFLRLRRRGFSSRACSCGTSLVSDWLYCPDCGRSADAAVG